MSTESDHKYFEQRACELTCQVGELTADVERLRAACIDALAAFQYIDDYSKPINIEGKLIAALKSTGMNDDELQRKLERKREE